MMIPRTLSRSLARQETAVLCEIRDLVQNLIDERNEAEGATVLAAEVQIANSPHKEVLEERKTSTITYRLEKVSCGKGCRGCPHGPYWYGYWKEGGKTRSKYIGKNLAVKA